MTLSIQQAADAARSAGFSGDSLVTIVAIGMAESGLDPLAHNAVMPDDSRGWLQVNVQPRANPQYAGWNLYDPATCAKAAFAISSNGTNFAPWTTYTLGVSRQYVAQVQAALGVSPMPVTVAKPAWTFVGTNGQNLWKGRRLPPIALVTHIMDGTLAGCDSWFSNPAAQASANFGVGTDGAIHCYVDPDGPDAPFANGNVTGPDPTAQALVTKTGGVNPNYWTVSIEHEGRSGDVLTPAQLDASGHLAAWLCQHFDIPADEDHLLGHYEFDSVTRSACPGWNRAGWLAWEAAIQKYLGGAPAPAPVPVPPPSAPTLVSLAGTFSDGTTKTLWQATS